MFSRRADWDLTPNPLTARARALRAAGAELVDLTSGNPTACGLGQTVATVLAPLVSAGALRYAPHPAGLQAAREAVCAYYAEHGVRVRPDRVLLTASTSEAYAVLFKLLGDPGDRVLVPRPGYPLFELLLRLEGLEPQPYARASVRGVRGGLEGGAIAVLAVHPDNPTGRYLRDAESAGIVDLCRRHGAAVIVDEVFLDYALGPRQPQTHAGASDALCFTLSGLSKVCGLPTHKLGWIVVGGPERLAADAMARLEVMYDTYLSVATPVQHALPALLAARGGFQAAVMARVRANRQALEAAGVPLAEAEAGWAAVIVLPDGTDDEAVALDLVDRLGVLVHPGYLFDYQRTARLVVSLLPAEEVFSEGVRRLAAGLTL